MKLFALSIAMVLTGCAPFAYTLAGQAAEKAQDAQNRLSDVERRTGELESQVRILRDARARAVESAYEKSGRQSRSPDTGALVK